MYQLHKKQPQGQAAERAAEAVWNLILPDCGLVFVKGLSRHPNILLPEITNKQNSTNETTLLGYKSIQSYLVGPIW